MSKKTFLTTVMMICLGILAAALTRGIIRTIGFTGYHYDHANRYSVGGTEINMPVDSLDIHWLDGAISIDYHAKNTVIISETASKEISNSAALRWWLDGSTLRIQYAKNGLSVGSGLQKKLTVTMPEGSVFDYVQIDATSADVNIPALRSDTTKADLTSGNLSLSQVGPAEKIDLSSTSGAVRAVLENVSALSIKSTSGTIVLNQSGSVKEIKLDSTSGNISATLGTVKTITAEATSGDIRLDMEAADKADISSSSGKISTESAETGIVKLKTTSGAVEMKTSAFDEIRIDTTSGNVTVTLPSVPGFHTEIATSSGSFDSLIALKREGNRYSCGNGSAALNIETTSGNIRLLEIGK